MNLGYIRGFGLGAGGDLDQDYCAAKALLKGQSIYSDLNGLCNTAVERNRTDVENFHPPITVLFLLPFVLADVSIQHTFIAWGILMMLIYTTIVFLSLREFEIAPHLRLVLLGFALLWFPQISQSMNGQFSTVVLGFVFLGWRMQRIHKDALSGVALGVAIAVKLFPGLLAIYLLLTRRFRAFAALTATFLLLQGLMLAVVGRADFVHYYASVLPEDSKRFMPYAMNQSFTGTAISLLRPNPYFENLLDWPQLGPMLALVMALALVGHATWSAYRRDGVDAAHHYWHFVALSVILCPISWDHTVIVMVPLCALLLARFGAANQLTLLFVVAGAMLLANHNDLESIRTLQSQNPIIHLADLWQAKAQLLGTLVIVGLSGVLLSVRTLAIPKVSKVQLGSLPDWNAVAERR